MISVSLPRYKTQFKKIVCRDEWTTLSMKFRAYWEQEECVLHLRFFFFIYKAMKEGRAHIPCACASKQVYLWNINQKSSIENTGLIYNGKNV